MRAHVVLLALLLGCHEAPSSPASTSTPAPPASTADADALWAVAPDGAIFGLVATPRAVAGVEHAWQDVRAYLAGVPELAPIDAALRTMLPAGLGSAGTTLAQLGLDPGKGAAVFVGDHGDLAMIVPVGDRDKFVSVAHGTRNGDTDTIEKATCRMVAGVYACVSSPALFARLGKGGLSDKLAAVGARGDLEFVAPRLPLSRTATSTIAGVVEIARGAFTLRAIAIGLPSEVAVLGPPGPVPSDATTTGFGAFTLPPQIRSAPAEPVFAGVTLADLARALAGRVTFTTTTGSLGFDVHVPLTDPRPFQTLISHCGDIPKLAAAGAKASAGGCSVPIPQLGADYTARVDGNELHLAVSGAASGGPGTPMTAIGSELAHGAWSLAFWGRGTMFAPSPAMAAAIQRGQLPPEAVALLNALGMLSEVGIGVAVDHDTARVLIAVRTAWANPDDVIRDLEAIPARDMLAGRAGEHAKAIAARAPSSPFASDFAAGATGLLSPVAAVGIVAAIAVPAFLDYMHKSKKTEASLQLHKLMNNLKTLYITNGAFPVGDVAPPATCCTGPTGGARSIRPSGRTRSGRRSTSRSTSRTCTATATTPTASPRTRSRSAISTATAPRSPITSTSKLPAATRAA